MTIQEKKVPVTHDGPRPVIEFVDTEKEAEKDELLDKDQDTVITEAELDEAEAAVTPAVSPEKQLPATVTPGTTGIARFNGQMKDFFQPGTFTRNAFGAACGGTLAVLCLTIGFWPAMLIGGAACGGVFLSSLGDGKKNLIDEIKQRMES